MRIFFFFVSCCFMVIACQSSHAKINANKSLSNIYLNKFPVSIALKNNVPYEEVKARIREKKHTLTTIDSTRSFFIRHLADSIIPYWYGTAWDFNGITETPGKGYIACGYFVTTTIRHMQFPINRYKVAQLPSSGIVHSLVQKKFVRNYSTLSFIEFITAIKQMGRAFYIIGLDNHVGYLYCDGTELFFIHSTFVGSRCVMKEVAANSPVLAASSYRLVGSLTADETFLKKWLNYR